MARNKHTATAAKLNRSGELALEIAGGRGLEAKRKKEHIARQKMLLDSEMEVVQSYIDLGSFQEAKDALSQIPSEVMEEAERRAKYWIARATCEDGLGQRDMAVSLFDQGAKMTMGDEKNAVYEALMAF